MRNRCDSSTTTMVNRGGQIAEGDFLSPASLPDEDLSSRPYSRGWRVFRWRPCAGTYAEWGRAALLRVPARIAWTALQPATPEVGGRCRSLDAHIRRQ